VAHGDAIIDGDGIELLGDTARLLDFGRDQLPDILEVHVAGTNCVKELTTAMIGLPKSPSFMPVARHSARAPAMFRPWVEVRER
jgi:hypothetical protein